MWEDNPLLKSVVKWSNRESYYFFQSSQKLAAEQYEYLTSVGSVYISYNFQTELGQHKKLNKIFARGTAHNYLTYWWIEYSLGALGTVIATFKQVRITKYAWYKLTRGMPLTDYEKGNIYNLPFKLIDSDAYAITKINANWGSRPVRVDRIRKEALSVLVLVNGLTPKGECPDPSTSFRVSGNPITSLSAVKRNSEKFDGTKISLNELISRFCKYDSLDPLVIPTIPKDFTLYDIFFNSGLKVNKLVGSVSILDKNKTLTKRAYYAESAAIACHLIDLFTKNKGRWFDRNPFFDVSIYSSGGRNKKNFNKQVGDVLASRPVWMCSPISECFLNFITRIYVDFYRTSSPTHPLYLGKSLKGDGWKEIVLKVKDPNRKCTHGDYSKWDSTVPLKPLIVALAIFRQSLPDGLEFDNLMRFISFGLLAHPLSVLNGSIIGFRRGMPSGHPLTSTINCIVHLVLRNFSFSKYFLKDFRLLFKKFNKIPILSCFLGDDFAYSSTHPDADDLVVKIGESISKNMKVDWGMDLDPPYIGNFGTDNPDNGSFEFLKVNFTSQMYPTVKSQELINRVVLPESSGGELNLEGLRASISSIPLHAEGVSAYFLLQSYIYDLCSSKLVTEISILDGILDKETTLKNRALSDHRITWTGIKKAREDDNNSERVIFYDFLSKQPLFTNAIYSAFGNREFEYSTLRTSICLFGALGLNLVLGKNPSQAIYNGLKTTSVYDIASSCLFR